MLRRFATSPAVIFVVAFALRVIAVGQIIRTHGLLWFYGANEPSHIAASLVSGLGFSGPYAGAPILPTAQQPPIYPLLLAGIFKVFGPYTLSSAWAGLLLNALSGAASAVLIFYLCRRYFGESAAIAAAWFWTLWVYEICIVTAMLSNFCISGTAFLLFLLLFERAREKQSGWFAVGVLAGIITLLQTTFVIVFVACAAWLLWRKPRAALLFAFGVGLLVTPWTVRNYVKLHEFIPVRDNFGMELWIGNRSAETKDFSGDFPDHNPSRFGQIGETAFMREKQQEAVAYIRSNPQGFLYRSGHRFVEFWTEPYWSTALLAVFALIGMLLNFRKVWPLAAVMILFPLVYYVTHSWTAYRHPIEPVMIVLSAGALSSLVNAVRLSPRLGLQPLQKPELSN